jgi:hypothetical protein
MTDTPDSMPVTGEVVDESFAGKGEWLAPPLAAIRLDISERTLWRRVDAGKLRKRIISGRAQVYVPLSGVMPATAESRENAEENRENVGVVPVTPPDTLVPAVIHELRVRREQDTSTIASLTARLTELERENAVLQHKVIEHEKRRWRWPWQT